MKNYSKKNNSGKKSNRFPKKSESKNYSKSDNFSRETKSFPNNNKINRNSSNQKDEFYQVKPRGKNEKTLYYSRKQNSSKKDNLEFYSKNDKFSSKIPNKKDFDDWIWGKHSVYSSLTTERAINRIWCTSEIFSSEKFYTLLKDQKSKGVLIEEVSWNRISQLTNGATHQGIAMQLAASKTIPLNKLIEFSTINSTNPIILALDGITDPHNLGAIIRSAEAFNCKGIVIPQRRSSGLTGTVAKVAAGALEHIPISRVVNLNRALEELKSKGFMTVGLSSDAQFSISNFKEVSPLVIIVGAEDRGISLITQKKCDFLLNIPLKGKTSSLNASVATAISLFYFSNR